MKFRALIIIAILVFVSSNFGFCQEIRQLPNEGSFDYALIEDTHFYTPNRSRILGRSDYINKTSLDINSLNIIHYSSGSNNIHLPYSWSKGENELFVANFMHYKNKAPALIDYRPFESRNKAQLKQSKEKLIRKHTLSNTPLNDYNWTLTTHHPNYLSDSIRELYINSLSFDISIKTNNLTFYLSDRDALYIWNCKIPSKGERYADWDLIAVYTSKYFKEEFIPRNESKSYNKQKEIRKAIKDTLFFDGHFKVIVQNEENYIINRNHGYIYHLGAKNLTRIGQVQVTEDYPRIQGKSLFIEDRDNNEIIFFAPVKWTKNKLPKPRVRIMNQKQMQKKFEHVL